MGGLFFRSFEGMGDWGKSPLEDGSLLCLTVCGLVPEAQTFLPSPKTQKAPNEVRSSHYPLQARFGAWGFGFRVWGLGLRA